MMDRRTAVKRITILLGGALSAPTLAGVMGGCQAPGPGDASVLQSLTTGQDELLAVLTEHIIPETDTPGARAARVSEYIDAMLTDFYSDEERARFLAGLAKVEERTRNVYGNSFMEASADQQIALLTMLDEEAFPDLAAMSDQERAAHRQRRAEEGNAFFATVKELTVSGYYTSEVGATQELRVNPMGIHEADIPYADLGRAWA